MSQRLLAEMHPTIRYQSAENPEFCYNSNQRLQVGEIKTKENKIEIRLQAHPRRYSKRPVKTTEESSNQFN